MPTRTWPSSPSPSCPSARREWARDEVEMLVPVITEAIERSGVGRGVRSVSLCSGSSDFLTGRPFSFVIALDAVGAFPPIEESHVEMDGAWALYEAWVRLSHGDIDTALVYAFGRSSLGEVRDVLAMQLDPYYVAPLWPDTVSLAALQARALLDTGRATERSMAEVAARSRRSANGNPFAQLRGSPDADALLADPYLVAPLRRHDCPPISDGACAMVLAAGDRARKVCSRPAWIRGIDHRIEPHALGARDLTRSPSTTLAAERAGVTKVAAPGRRRRDPRALHAPGDHPPRSARPRCRHRRQPLGGRARGEPHHGRRAHARRRGGAEGDGREREAAPWRTPRAGPASSRTSSACSRGTHEPLRGHRCRADEARLQAGRRLPRRAGAGGRRARARGRGSRLAGHGRGGDRQGPRHVRGRDDARALPRRRARRRGQAYAPRAHGGQRRRLHRDRRGEPRPRRRPPARAHRRLREAVGERRHVGALAASTRSSPRSSRAPAAISRPSCAPTSAGRAPRRRWACSSP